MVEPPEGGERFREAELALGEFLARRESEADLSFAAWCADRPHIARELRELHAEWLRIEMLDGGSPSELCVPVQPSRILARIARRKETFTEDYSIGETIARGGMGEILSVRDETLRRELAMKVVRGRDSALPSASELDPTRLARFLEEAQVTGQLDHPGIVPVHELGVDSDGRIYFTMKLVRGRNLEEIFDLVHREAEGWGVTRALGVILKACEALAYAHEKGVIHRDLKPSNVMVGGFGEVYVMDWGLARVLGTQDIHDLRLRTDEARASVHTERRDERESAPDSPLCTMDGNVLGTPAYMSPEQARGEIEKLSPRSDVYSLGAMLYHLLARHMPYEVSDAKLSGRSVLWKLIEGPPVRIHALRRDVPAELVAICEKAMAREPDDRYPNMLALAEDLRAWLEHRVVGAYQTGALVELRKWVERNRALAGASAAAVVLALGGLGSVGYVEARGRKTADEQRTIARANEELAKRNEATTREEKVRADREADAATKRADEVLRLSASQRLANLEEEADRLWPAVPERLPEYALWLERARELVAGLDPHGDDPGHRARLAKLREKAVALTEEERANKRRAAPRYAEQQEVAKHVAVLRAAREVRAGRARPATFELDTSQLPSDARGLTALARPLVSPTRTEFGREAEGLALARLAIERVEDDESAAQAGFILAWALFASGLDEEALQESAMTLDAAPEKERKVYQRFAIDVRAAVDGARDGSELSDAEARLADLEAEVSATLLYPFKDEQDTWWHHQLAKLVAEIEALEDPRTGLIAGVSPPHGWGIERRRDFAATVAERSVTGELARRLWSNALASIASPRECPRYHGLRITPQLGLLPLGRDPDSGLWEFADLLSGDPPERGPDGKLVLDERMGLVFVLLPGGTFQMGAQREDPAGPNYDPNSSTDERPVHPVSLSPFFLSKYEMTQGQWERFTGRNPSSYGPNQAWPSWNRDLRGWSGLHPVEQVSWPDCMETLERLGMTLPTEAEWEFACRAGTTGAFWTGDDKQSLQGTSNLSDAFGRSHGNEDWTEWESWLDDGQSVHAEIGSFRANPFGLHDMHGNVREWCRDSYSSRSYGGILSIDPVAVLEDNSFRVTRGGSFDDVAADARSANRNYATPDGAAFSLGLRPARVITP